MTEEIKAVYMGEAMLLRWGESASQGRTVTLQLDEEAQVHPFKGLKASGNGQRMKLCAVLIDDHEQPQEPERARRIQPAKATATPTDDAKPTKHFRDLKKAAQAALKLQDEAFKAWLVDTYWAGKEEIGDYDGLLKRALGIASKSELDSNPYKGKLWDELLTSFDYRERA